MDEDDFSLFQGPNPYNFRDPIKDPARLVGRERELTEIEKNFETAASGGTGHMAIIGDRAAGKTSLLNGAAHVARRMGVLPVRLDLDSAVVASSASFFFALIEAVVEALIGAQKERLVSERSGCTPDLGWYQAWRSRVYGGDRGTLFPEERLNFGLVHAAALHGMTPRDVGPALLRHDFDELKALASATEKSGFALLLDEADVLGREVALLEKLRNLVQATQGWTLVLAGTKDLFSHVGDVFSPIPRQFTQITVSGYRSSTHVRQCIVAPLSADTRSELDISPDVVFDILRLTEGEPYEITLVLTTCGKLLGSAVGTSLSRQLASSTACCATYR